jgi:hypothetical protein
MEVDGNVQADMPAKGDDLAQYKLDEYDEDDIKEDGMSLDTAYSLMLMFRRHGSIQQY